MYAITGPIQAVGSLIDVCNVLSDPNPDNLASLGLRPFLQIYECWMSSSSCKVPLSFRGKVSTWFAEKAGEEEEDAVDRAESQVIVKVFNRWTCEDTVYCPERARYESAKKNEWDNSVVHSFASSSDTCDFCSPLQMTAEDLWGRVERPTCLTSSSIGKFDECHGMVVFRDHEPLNLLTEDHLTDMLSCAREWFLQSHAHQTDMVFPSLHWNFLPPAGASMYHAHTHLCLASRHHVGYWERLQRVAQEYLQRHDGDYFTDLIAAHQCLGLCHTVYNNDRSERIHILVHLTSALSREILIIAHDDGLLFARALLYTIKDILHKHLGPAFMLAVYFPPLKSGADVKSDKKPVHMPLLARVVHRSSSIHKSDLCARRALNTNYNVLDPVQFARLLNWPLLK